MTELDQMIAAAYQAEGRQQEVNKVYVTLLRSSLFLPVKKEKEEGDDEPFRPLYAKLEEHIYMVAFDTLERLQQWAGDQVDKIGYVELLGMDLIAGMNEGVLLGLNVGTAYYKEFSSDEVMHLKKMVAKIEQLKQS